MWTLDMKENEGQVFFTLIDKITEKVVTIDVDQPVSVIKNQMLKAQKHKGATIFLTSGNRDIDIIYHGFGSWELINESDVYEFKVSV